MTADQLEHRHMGEDSRPYLDGLKGKRQMCWAWVKSACHHSVFLDLIKWRRRLEDATSSRCLDPVHEH